MHIKHSSQCLVHSELAINRSWCLYVRQTLCLPSSAPTLFTMCCQNNLLQHSSNVSLPCFFYENQVLTAYRIKSKSPGLTLSSFQLRHPSLVWFPGLSLTSVPHSVSFLTLFLLLEMPSPPDYKENTGIAVTILLLSQNCLLCSLGNRILHRDSARMQDKVKRIVKGGENVLKVQNYKS